MRYPLLKVLFRALLKMKVVICVGRGRVASLRDAIL